MKHLLSGSAAALTLVFAPPAPGFEADTPLGTVDFSYRILFSGAGAYVDSGDEDFAPVLPDDFVLGYNTELQLRASTIFDNGMELSLRANLEEKGDSGRPLSPFHDDDDGGLVEEAFVQLSTGFGWFILGKQDGVGDDMIFDAPQVFRKAALTGTVDGFDPFEARTLNGLNLDTEPDFSDDYAKFIWQSPRVFGAQVGFSYTPIVEKRGPGFNFDTSAIDDTGFGNNFIEFAANWKHRVSGDFGVGVSAGYGRGASGPFTQGPKEWFAGGEIIYTGGEGTLTFAGAYTEQRHSPFGGAGSDWNIGVLYERGDWQFGATYAEGWGLTNDAVAGTGRDQRAVEGGVSYDFAEWLRVGIGAMYLNDHSSNVLALNGGAGSDSFAVFTVIELKHAD